MNQDPKHFGQSDLVRLNDEDAAIAVLERAVTGLWDVVNELTRLRRSSRLNYRVTIFAIVSDAFIVVPGGIGSLLEMSLVWQLRQVHRLHNTPLILVGKMWESLVGWGREWMLRDGIELASEGDFDIPDCVGTIDEAIALIRGNRAAWLNAQPPAGS